MVIDLKNMILLLLFIVSAFADNTEEIFLGTVDRSTLVGKRVTVAGVIEAKGCEKKPCKILVKRKIKSALVIMSLTFDDKYQTLVNKKWIASPIVASCVYKTPFIYTNCSN